MITDTENMKARILQITRELVKEKDGKRKAQLMLERSVFADMLMGETGKAN